jgi:hypothetical protein
MTAGLKKEALIIFGNERNHSAGHIFVDALIKASIFAKPNNWLHKDACHYAGSACEPGH